MPRSRSRSLLGDSRLGHIAVVVLVRGGEPEFPVQLKNFVWPQARNGQHLKNVYRDFLARLFKRRMAPCCVKLFDYVRDGLAYARNILQAFLGDHLIRRESQSQQIIRRARVGFCSERIISSQRFAYRK